jgi:alcohol dehydrogenase
MDLKRQAYELLNNWKGSAYIHGLGVLDRVGEAVAALGRDALVIANTTRKSETVEKVLASLADAGITFGEIVPTAKPNSPKEDVLRLSKVIASRKPEVIITIGGGSAIDATKAANALATLGGDVDQYFGTDLVAKALKERNLQLIPTVAVMTAASSAAHLTKYANVTDLAAGQKKLIVDNALVPTLSVFDYTSTVTMPKELTIDGAFDTIAHTLEVYLGSHPETIELTGKIAECAIRLVVENAPILIDDPNNEEAREALGLASDLGGYAIMVGGTSGAHLTSFSLVDIVAHGTACGIMNPYYVVLFGRAIEQQLNVVGPVFGSKDTSPISVAEAMIAFAKSIGAPTKLNDIEGFSEAHIVRALAAAKNPQLKMKLQNMPIPMDATGVDTYMAPLLQAAAEGDLTKIKAM